MGVYHHPAVGIPGVYSHEVADSYLNEAAAFLSAYAAKSVLFLRRVLP